MKEQHQTTKQGKTLAIIVGIISAISAYFVYQIVVSSDDIDSQLKNAALELNKQTPMEIDQFTRLDSVSSIGKTNFIYYYTLIGLEKSEVNLDTVNKYIRPNIIDNVKNSPELKIYRDHKITMDYKYYDSNGAFATEISVTPDLYKSE